MYLMYLSLIVPLVPFVRWLGGGGMVAWAAQPLSLGYSPNSTRLCDSVHQATSQVQRRSRDFSGSQKRTCLARGDCCPPGKRCMRPLQHWLHSRVPRWSWRHGTYRVTITQMCRHSFSPWSDLAFLWA